MEAIERRSESPLLINRSSSRLSNISSQDFSDDSDTALIEHVKSKKKSRPKKQKEKENGDVHPDENGTDEQIQTNGTSSDHGSYKQDDEDPSIINSAEVKESHIVVMELSRENSEVGEDGEMIDLQIEEAEVTVEVDDNSSNDNIVVFTTSESVINQEGETLELSVTEIPDARVEVDEAAPDKDDGKPGLSEQEVQNDFDDHKPSNENDADRCSDRWSVTVNIDSSDQKELLENQSENADKEADTSNSSFTNKISSLLGSWSPIRDGKRDTENVPVFYPRISGRQGLKSATPDRNLAGPSKEIKTPANLSRFLDDSFRVKSEPAKFNRGEDKSYLKKYRGKRCLNADESEENEEGFFSRLSFRKRRKLNDSTESTSGFFGSVFRSPFKKRSVADVNKAETSQESKFAWLFSPFTFGKKKPDEDNNDDDVSSAEIAVEESTPAPSTSEDVIKTDDKPLEANETGGCSIM